MGYHSISMCVTTCNIVWASTQAVQGLAMLGSEVCSGQSVDCLDLNFVHNIYTNVHFTTSDTEDVKYTWFLLKSGPVLCRLLVSTSGDWTA